MKYPCLPGQILMRDENDEWHCVWPKRRRTPTQEWLAAGVAMLVIGLVVIAALMFAATRAHANDLPNGATCDDVIFYASHFNVPDTVVGRARAKIIAAALGFKLTDAQLDAARRCLKSAGAK